MPPVLLASQLATLEPPGAEEALTVDVAGPPEAVAATVLARLGLDGPPTG
jgi:gluconate kinase